MEFAIIILPSLLLGVAFISKLKLSLRDIVICALLLAAGLLLRYAHLNYVSDDYQTFISVWLDYLASNGGFLGLGQNIGDYTPPYLYILAAISYSSTHRLAMVKSVSIIFDVFLSMGCFKLCSVFTDSKFRCLAAFFAVFFLPTVFLNSSCWAQCDSIYVSFIIWAMYLFLSDRPWGGVALTAVALSFKLQTVFILPMGLPLLVRKKVKPTQLLIFIPVFLIMMLPAVLFGRSLWDILGVYIGQTAEYSSRLTLNAGNFYYLISDWSNYEGLFMLGLCLAAATCAVAVSLACIAPKASSNSVLLAAAFLISLLLPFFLPAMHERYFYLAAVLSMVVAFSLKDCAPLPFLVEAGSFWGYYAYLRLQYLFSYRYAPYFFLAASLYGWFILAREAKKLKYSKKLVDKC